MSQYTVLCVDTPDAVAEVRSTIAATDGLTPVVRTSAEGAIEALDEEPVDCVVTGYGLPDGSGLSVLEAVRAETPQLPCVLFTMLPPGKIDTSLAESAVVEYIDRGMDGAFDRLGFVVEDIITHNAHAGFPLPADEQSRLEALSAYDVDALPIEESFERLTGLIASHFDVPVAFIGLIDSDTERFVACSGADWESMPREESVCTHSMLQEAVMVVENISEDARFRDNDLLRQLGITSYAGANITTPTGETIGQLCVIDHEPRTYSTADRTELQEFADVAMELLELRASVDEAAHGREGR